LPLIYDFKFTQGHGVFISHQWLSWPLQILCLDYCCPINMRIYLCIAFINIYTIAVHPHLHNNICMAIEHYQAGLENGKQWPTNPTLQPSSYVCWFGQFCHFGQWVFGPKTRPCVRAVIKHVYHKQPQQCECLRKTIIQLLMLIFPLVVAACACMLISVSCLRVHTNTDTHTHTYSRDGENRVNIQGHFPQYEKAIFKAYIFNKLLSQLQTL